MSGETVLTNGLIIKDINGVELSRIDGPDITVSTVNGFDFPTVDGNAGEVLATDGNKSLTFIDLSSLSGSSGFVPLEGTGISISPSGSDYLFEVDDYVSATTVNDLIMGVQNDITDLDVDIVSLSGSKVSKTGDTMTGDLQLDMDTASVSHKLCFGDPFAGVVLFNQDDQLRVATVMKTEGIILPSSSDLLDKYYGLTSWTPELEGDSGGKAHTYATQEAYFSRVGDVVNVTINIEITTLDGTMSGDLKITGFPFAHRPIIDSTLTVLGDSGFEQSVAKITADADIEFYGLGNLNNILNDTDISVPLTIIISGAFVGPVL